MVTRNTLLLLLFTSLYFTNAVQAEGSRELLNGTCANSTYIQIWDNNDSSRCFATYNCSANHRLNIRCKNGDKIYFGYYCSNQDVYYRLKDPSGTVVMGPTLIKSSSSKGWISSCAKAIIGPDSLYSGGYNPLVYKTLTSGDYYIEFAVNNNATTYSKREFYFDITVTSGGIEKKGRIWSKDWDFNTVGATNPFVANLYVYTTDSVVTEIIANGALPKGFTISCNSTGASNIGTISQMRKTDYKLDIISSGGTPSAPEYPIFLNNPDSTLFPTGAEGKINSVILSTCYSGGNCINVNVSKIGTVDITLVFPGGSTRQLTAQAVNIGSNCIMWDGLDGNGNNVGDVANIQIEVNYERGLTNLPTTDIENNPNGFKVALVRPTHDANGNAYPTPQIFWNDSLLTDPANSLDGISNLTGCTGGCHKWQNRGVSNTNPEVMNTWWYLSQQENLTTQGCSYTLPLILISFSGEPSGNNTVLNWITATETNLKEYEIEKSINGSDFIKIGEVNAHNTGWKYYFTDTSALETKGTLYYRLKIINDDNTYTFSSVISIISSGSNINSIAIAPNPNKGNNFSATLFGNSGSQLTIKVFSDDGRLITSLPVIMPINGKLTTQFNLSRQLSAGLYIVESFSDGGIVASHMMVY